MILIKVTEDTYQLSIELNDEVADDLDLAVMQVTTLETGTAVEEEGQENWSQIKAEPVGPFLRALQVRERERNRLGSWW